MAKAIERERTTGAKKRAFTRAFVAAGSNLAGPLGPREKYLDAAKAALDSSPGVAVVRESPRVHTAPVGGPPGQGPYLNAVFEVETTLAPRALFKLLAEVEKALGRDKKGDWGPRTIDLDLVLHGDEVVNEKDLVVPHPRMHERKFVLEPLVALDPGLTHPVLGKTVAQLLAELK